MHVYKVGSYFRRSFVLLRFQKSTIVITFKKLEGILLLGSFGFRKRLSNLNIIIVLYLKIIREFNYYYHKRNTVTNFHTPSTIIKVRLSQFPSYDNSHQSNIMIIITQ